MLSYSMYASGRDTQNKHSSKTGSATNIQTQQSTELSFVPSHHKKSVSLEKFNIPCDSEI